MNAHFGNFTPEAMRAFAQELADSLQRRVEFLHHNRNHTFTLLADSRKDHASAEAKRREHASREADARRLFMSELKSGVHSLLGRFELSRKEMAEDLQSMAGEFQAACDAFQHRPARTSGVSRSHLAGPPTKHPPKPQPSSTGPRAFRAADGPESAKASAPTARPPAESPDGGKARSGSDDKPGDAKKHSS